MHTLSIDDRLHLARSMRSQGATFDEIAAALRNHSRHASGPAGLLAFLVDKVVRIRIK